MVFIKESFYRNRTPGSGPLFTFQKHLLFIKPLAVLFKTVISLLMTALANATYFRVVDSSLQKGRKTFELTNRNRLPLRAVFPTDGIIDEGVLSFIFLLNVLLLIILIPSNKVLHIGCKLRGGSNRVVGRAKGYGFLSGS